MKLAFKYDGGEEERLALVLGFRDAGFNAYAVGQAHNATQHVIVDVSTDDVRRFLANIDLLCKPTEIQAGMRSAKSN